MRSICTVTFVRNAAKYIVPHLSMYQGLKNYICYLEDKPKNWYIYPDEPDNSKELIEKYFPGVETFTISGDDYNGDMLNRVREKVSEEVMIFLHADVILSDKDLARLIEYIQATDFDLYRLDMQKCMIDYYHDFDHGVRDCVDHDPIAMSKQARFHSLYWTDVTPNHTCLIDWEDFTAHHFNGWKGVFAQKDWIENKIPTEAGTYMKSLEDYYGGWLSCPQEIRDKFSV